MLVTDKPDERSVLRLGQKVSPGVLTTGQTLTKAFIN